MGHYAVVWVGILIFFLLLGMIVAPSGKRSSTSIIDVLSDTEMAASVEKYLNNEPKSWVEKQRLYLKQSRTGVSFESYIIVLALSIVICFAIGMFLLHNAFFGVLISSLGYLFPRSYVKRKREKLLEQFDSELVRPLDRMVAVLSASRTPTQALKEIAEAKDMPIITQAEFQDAYVETQFGKPIEEAFFSMAERTGSYNVLFIATQMAINREQGGNMAEILQRIRVSIMERIRLDRDLRAVTAEQRSQATAIIFIFVGVLALTMLIEPSMRHTLMGTVGGRFMLMFAAGMMAIGSIIIRAMTRTTGRG